MFCIAKFGSVCNKVIQAVDKPSKKQRVVDNPKKKDIHCVVNSLNSLWVCRHAINPTHECLFCMYNQCFLKISNNSINGQRNTRGRRNIMKSVDDKCIPNIMGASSEKCNAVDHHTHNLNQFGDSLYFTSAYKQKISSNNSNDQKRKKYVPFLCSKCKKHLVDK